jgi:L,D-peptidoglycan transpeptidase YkuD (ErfK/YbiS/YcfS/YnhG family)
MMDLVVAADGVAQWGGQLLRCALGRSGVRAVKREGDGATPAGAWPMRCALYRPDREKSPRTRLPLRPLSAADGWCDAPEDAAYNRAVSLPYPGHAESLWRADALYDLLIVLGYNDDPVLPGRGSAIFLHLARPDFAPTEGCIALARADLLLVLAQADPTSRVIVAVGAGKGESVSE